MAITEIERLRIEIRETLLSGDDIDYAKRMKTYTKDKFEYIGLSAGGRRTLIKPLIKKAKSLTVDDRFILAESLWQERYRECHYAAMDVLTTVESKIDDSYLPRVESLIASHSWWDTVDWLASHLAGAICRRPSPDTEAYLLKWLSSDNIWLNRTCLIHQLFYRDDTNFEKLKDYIYALEHKKEFFIQKAIGWSLRQYSKVNPYEVEEFIDSNPVLSNLARREGMKHINK